MRRIVKWVVHAFDVDMYLGDEDDSYIYLTKTAGNVVVEHLDHDFWTAGADQDELLVA